MHDVSIRKAAVNFVAIVVVLAGLIYLVNFFTA